MSNRPPPSPLPRLRVVAHAPDHAVAALRAAAAIGVAVTVESPPSAAGAQGAGWFKALIAQARGEVPAVEAASLLDCGDAAGLALAAIRTRAADAVRLSASFDVVAKVADMAAQAGMAVETERAEALDLQGRDDPLADCLAWMRKG